MVLSVVITCVAAYLGISAQRVLHRSHRRLSQTWYDVAVGVQRYGYRGVPQHFTHDLRVNAFREQQRRARMPEIVEPYVGQLGPT
jgi:hypothetical protein